MLKRRTPIESRAPFFLVFFPSRFLLAEEPYLSERFVTLLSTPIPVRKELPLGFEDNVSPAPKGSSSFYSPLLPSFEVRGLPERAPLKVTLDMNLLGNLNRRE